MPQTKYDVSFTDKARAEQIVIETKEITGVKWVNVNMEHHSIVVTHSEDYDEERFKAVAGI